MQLKLLALIAALATATAGASVATADPKPNEHNCVGVAASSGHDGTIPMAANCWRTPAGR